MSHGVVHALTVDVEDYFQVEAFAGVIRAADWDCWELRVERNVERILELLAAADRRATFFTLGWIAERRPALVKRIVTAGHELASHGFAHRRVDRQSPEAFRADIRTAKRVLEDVGGVAVNGYRAPCFSINAGNPWAFDVIGEEGHLYSSSVYPIRHDLYGMPDAPRAPYLTGGGAVLEIPLTTTVLWGRNLPCAGGGYFRLFPYALSRWLLRRVEKGERRPGVFYFHPWELDPGQPRVAGLPVRSRLRHYLHLGRMERRLQRLLADFAWDRIDRVYGIGRGHDRATGLGRHHGSRTGAASGGGALGSLR